MRSSLSASLLLLTAGVVAQASNAGDLLIEHAWARPTPPGITVGAVYFSITNRGTTADRLVAISSPLAQRSEIHESVMQSGVMSMHPVEFLDCPPGSTVKVTPGGIHLMLTGLKQPWTAGSVLPLTLTFQHAGEVKLTVPVQAPD